MREVQFVPIVTVIVKDDGTLDMQFDWSDACQGELVETARDEHKVASHHVATTLSEQVAREVDAFLLEHQELIVNVPNIGRIVPDEISELRKEIEWRREMFNEVTKTNLELRIQNERLERESKLIVHDNKRKGRELKAAIGIQEREIERLRAGWNEAQTFMQLSLEREEQLRADLAKRDGMIEIMQGQLDRRLRTITRLATELLEHTREKQS